MPGSSNNPVLQSSTLFSSSSSTPTSKSTTTVPTLDGLLTAPQSPQTTSPSASSASHVDSSFVSSSVTSATSATNAFRAKQEPDASHSVVSSGGPSLTGSTKTLPNTFPTTMTSRSTTALLGPVTPFGSTSSTFPTQSKPTTLVSSAVSFVYSSAPFSSSGPAAWDASSIWATSSTKQYDDGVGVSTSDPAPESTSTRVSTPASVHSKSHMHTFTKRPKAPQQIVSTSPDLVTVVTQTTQSGIILQTTITLESIGPGSLVPVPTTSNSIFPNSSSNSNSVLPLILGLVLGTLGIVVLGVAFFRCRARRQSTYMPNALSCDSETSRERKDRMTTEETSCVDAVTRITSYRPSSAHAAELVTTCISHAGESFQSSIGQLSDPFADSSTILSSRTSMPPASIRSADSVSTNMEFTGSVITDTHDAGDSGGLIDASTSSLELHFVPPLVARHDSSSTRSPYLSPTWHYDGLPPRWSSREEFGNEEEQGETSHIAPPAPSRPFSLEGESARLHLHALLKEARRV